MLSHAAPGIQKGRQGTTSRASHVMFPSFYSFELVLKCFASCTNKSFIPILTIFAAKSYDSGHEPRLQQIYQLDSGKKPRRKVALGDVTYLKRFGLWRVVCLLYSLCLQH